MDNIQQYAGNKLSVSNQDELIKIVNNKFNLISVSEKSIENSYQSAIRLKDSGFDELRMVLKEVFVWIGIPLRLIPDTRELDSITNQFIGMFATKYTIEDVILAFKLGIRQELDMSIELGSKELGYDKPFSLIFLVSVMKSYDRYSLAIIKAAANKKNNKTEDKLSPEQSKELMKQYCNEAFDRYLKDEKYVLDGGNSKYNFLVENGLINFSEDEKNSQTKKTKAVLENEYKLKSIRTKEILRKLEVGKIIDELKNGIFSNRILNEIEFRTKEILLNTYFKNEKNNGIVKLF